MSNSGEVETQAPPSEPPVTAVEGYEKVVEAAVEPPVVDAKEDEKKPKRERKQKVVKEKKDKKPKAPSHPPYFQMIKEAITALNEKGGSSPYAIAKYMEQNHKSVLPSNFRKILGLQLKNSVSKGKLMKIKASYKLTEAAKKREKPTITTRAARANAAKEPTAKNKNKNKKKQKSKAVSKIESLPMSTPTGRRSKRSGATAKKVKPIKPPVAKKAKKGTA